MSTLDEISIQGIRSYHPHEKQTVKFQKPLTLILGENGCGKTTIIECLKFITCSDQPKNTKSGGFVWDPKLSDCQTVKGNVKLLFHDIKNIPVAISKSLESVQHLKTISTKSIDQTITRQGTNISRKCAEVDDSMATYLGVSKPILKDVIFCHQEESNWPLDEDKKLKEKFDSIFDVGKYDKCIDQIRKELKHITEEKRASNINVGHMLKYRDEARSKRATMDDKIFKLEEISQEIKQVEEELKPLDKKYNDILHIEQNLSSLTIKLGSTEEHLKSIKLAQKDLKLLIKQEFSASDKELDDALDNFNKNLLEKEEERNRLTEEKSKAMSTEKEKQENISKEQVKLGQYQSFEKQYQKNLDIQKEKINELKDNIKIDLPVLTEFNRTETIDNISKELSIINNQFKSTQKQYGIIENKMQSDIDTIRVEKANVDQEIKIKEKQILENASEIKKLKEDVDQIKYSADRLVVLQKLTVDNENNLKTLKESLNIDETKAELNKKKQEKYNINLKLENIEKEVQTLQLLNREQVELDSIKSNKFGNERKLQILKNKVNDVINELLGFVPQKNFNYEFTKVFDKLSSSIKSNRKNIAEKEKQLTIFEANHKHTIEKLHAKQRTLTDDETALYDMCQGQEYETVLKEVKEKVEELQNQKGTVSTSGHLFRRYIQNLEAQDPCCPLCHRDFISVDEVTELINDLNMRVQKIPDELESTVSQLETFLEKQSKLQQLRPTFTRISVLNNTEIPQLKNELEGLNNTLKKCREELSHLTEVNKKLETNETSAKNIHSDIIIIDSCINEIARLEKEENRLVTKINNSGAKRNLQEAITEQKIFKNTLITIEKFLENKQHELDIYNEKLNELQQLQNKITTEELNIKSKLQAEKSLVDKLNDLQLHESVLSVELVNAKKAIGPIEQKLEARIKDLEQTKNQQNEKIENDRKEIMINERKYQEIMNLQTLINEYKNKGWALHMEETRNLIENLTKEKNQCVEIQIKVQEKIDAIKEYNARQEVQKIDLENNKKLRNKLKEETVCCAKISDLKKDVGNMDVDSLIIEKQKNRKISEHLFGKKSVCLGRKQELVNLIASIKKELLVSHYKDSERNYLHELVQLEILKRVEHDLMKYMNVLEKSLNDFHTVHMQSINTLIKQLWRDIYSGNDIEYIYIETASNDNKPVPINTKRRTFNYRVMQVKNNGIKLDMRGRCSAGQKVLACLIIRMALAETFSKSCGILALDEPTTNLDEINVQSLADSLSEIVKRRSTQKSFQLIIITHDPNFLRKLSARDLVDTFYLVQRNKNGISMVEEKDIKLLP